MHVPILARVYGPPALGPFLDRVGRLAARRSWRFVIVWLLAAIAIGALAIAAGGKTVDDFTIPGAESQRAIDLLEQRFPSQSGGSAQVVFHAPSGTLTTGKAEVAIEQVVARIKKLPHVTQVTGPLPSKDETIALVNIQYGEQVAELGDPAFEQLRSATEAAGKAGLELELGGPLTDYANQPASGIGDEIGLLVAVFILVLAFGSIAAAGLPIGTALVGLGIGLAGVFLLASVTDVGTVAPELGEMIGLGVGIDYSLFILTRYRENRAGGMEREAAIGNAVGTAGQAVLFAGTTVVIAICGLVVSGIPYVAMLGFASAIVVAVTMTAALTLLPALLGLVGHRVEQSHISLRKKQRPEASDDTGRPHGWARWATTVASHPVPFAIAVVVILLTLAAPFLSIRYGETDDGSAPATSTQRKAYDLVAEGFGPGANGPLLIVVTHPKGSSVPSSLISALKATHGVADVAPAQENSTGDTAIVTVVPTSAPDQQATTDLVERLRDDVLPPALSKSVGMHAYVGGATATYIDLGNKIAERLPYFIGAVVLLSFLLLMLVFRSVVIPATAAVMNLLSVGAAYGVVVAVFQWGWGKELFGLDSTVPIVSFVPMMMFAILFGLSMDYQVFLLTRVREEYDRSHETRTAVVNGLSATARVITSAALIMITVFMSFVANPTPEVKMFGLGLAVAVAVDATLVRMILVPALMELLGKANWWFPRFLGRVLPRIDIA